MVLPPLDFESSASAGSATPANLLLIQDFKYMFYGTKSTNFVNEKACSKQFCLYL